MTTGNQNLTEDEEYNQNNLPLKIMINKSKQYESYEKGKKNTDKQKGKTYVSEGYESFSN